MPKSIYQVEFKCRANERRFVNCVISDLNKNTREKERDVVHFV